MNAQKATAHARLTIPHLTKWQSQKVQEALDNRQPDYAAYLLANYRRLALACKKGGAL